jgi:hypothetical protein
MFKNEKNISQKWVECSCMHNQIQEQILKITNESYKWQIVASNYKLVS